VPPVKAYRQGAADEPTFAADFEILRKPVL
jgi:hypothetical protein